MPQYSLTKTLLLALTMGIAPLAIAESFMTQSPSLSETPSWATPSPLEPIVVPSVHRTAPPAIPGGASAENMSSFYTALGKGNILQIVNESWKFPQWNIVIIHEGKPIFNAAQVLGKKFNSHFLAITTPEIANLSNGSVRVALTTDDGGPGSPGDYIVLEVSSSGQAQLIQYKRYSQKPS